MPFDSEGMFSRLHNWEDDRINDIDIVTDHMDEEDDNFADGLSQCFLKSGNSKMEGNFNAGNFKLINVADGTLPGDAVNRGQLDKSIGDINSLEKIEMLEKQYTAMMNLEANKAYFMTLTGSIGFVLPSPQSGVFNQIVIELYMAEAFNIELGTDYYFGAEKPYLESAGYYTLIYEYDNIKSKWAVGAVKKGE